MFPPLLLSFPCSHPSCKIQPRIEKSTELSGFSHWRHVCEVSRFSHVGLYATPWTVARLLFCPWDFPHKNTGVGSHALLSTQVSNPRLLHLLHQQMVSFYWAFWKSQLVAYTYANGKILLLGKNIFKYFFLGEEKNFLCYLQLNLDIKLESWKKSNRKDYVIHPSF